jgi:hypothetical protein
MKPSKEYYQSRAFTADDFALFIVPYCAVSRAAMPAPPYAFRSDLPKMFERPIKSVPEQDVFLFKSTMHAEFLISEFCEWCVPVKPDDYRDAIAQIDSKRRRLPRQTRQLLCAAENNIIFMPSFGRERFEQELLYGEFVLFRQWLQSQLDQATQPQSQLDQAADQPKVIRVPVFTDEAKKKIIGALQPYLSKDDAKVLPDVLNGTAAKKPLKITGIYAKSVCTTLRDLYDDKSEPITGVTKKELADWIWSVFEFDNQPTIETVKRYLKPSQTTAKANRILKK